MADTQKNMSAVQKNGKDRTSVKGKDEVKGTIEVKDAVYVKDDDAESIVVELPQAPDGGWGWVIVLASVLANVIVDGITYTFGIFLPYFEESFHQPKSTIALAGSLQVGTYLCAGPIVSGLTNRFGCKRVTIAGSLIATFAFVISIYSPSVNILILTYGIIGGFGFGMMYLPAIVIVGYYFDKRRALATGIAVCGSGIGMFIMAPLSDFLLQQYDWRGALLIIAGIVLNGAVCGMLMRPSPNMEIGKGKAKSQTSNGTAKESKPLIETPESKSGKKKASVPESQNGTEQGESKFNFSSVPNIVYSSARSSADRNSELSDLSPMSRARSNTLDNAGRVRQRHVLPEETIPSSTPPSRAPIGLSYIGLSDASINKLREKTHLNVSRRDIMVSGSVLHISQHSLHQAHIRSITSIKSEYSTKSTVERVLCSCLPESLRDTLLQMLDVSIMKDKAYVFILIGNVCAMLGFYVPFVFIPERALGLGISKEKAAILLSIIGITNTVGRVLTGVLANLNKIDSLIINNIAMLICGLSTILCPFCNSFELLCFVSAVFGLCVAAFISLSSILLCEMLGVEQLTNAFGFLTLARGISSCAGSPLAGAIIDATKNIDLAFYAGGAMIVLGSLFHFMLNTPCFRDRRKNESKRDTEMDVVKLES